MENAEWSVIKNEYVSTGATQKELAKKYGVSISTLKKKSAREGWSVARQNESGTDGEDIQNADGGATATDKILATGRKLHGIINKSICKMTDAAEAEGTDGIDAGKIQKLAATLKILKEIMGDSASNGSAREHSELINVIKEAVSEK